MAHRSADITVSIYIYIYIYSVNYFRWIKLILVLRNVLKMGLTWVCCKEPESQRQSMEWKQTDSRLLKKFLSQRSMKKVMLVVFCDMKGLIIINLLDKKNCNCKLFPTGNSFGKTHLIYSMSFVCSSPCVHRASLHTHAPFYIIDKRIIYIILSFILYYHIYVVHPYSSIDTTAV